MSDPRVEQIKQPIISSQSGSGLDDISVYMGPCRQYGQGFDDVIRSCFRIVLPVIMRAVKTLFKTSSESLNNGSSIGDSFKSALKTTLRTALKHGGKALGKVIQEQEQPTAASPVGPPLLHQDERDAGTQSPPQPQKGAGRFKAVRKRRMKSRYIASKRPNIHYNF